MAASYAGRYTKEKQTISLGFTIEDTGGKRTELEVRAEVRGATAGAGAPCTLARQILALEVGPHGGAQDAELRAEIAARLAQRKVYMNREALAPVEGPLLGLGEQC